MKHFCKITWTDGQCRITIPKRMVKEAGLEAIKFVALEKNGNGHITIRRVIHEKTDKRYG